MKNLLISFLLFFLAACDPESRLMGQIERNMHLSVFRLHDTKIRTTGTIIGTGFQFIYKDELFLISNAHVCTGRGLNNSSFMFYTLPTGEVLQSKVLHLNRENDLCVLEPVPFAKPLPSARVADSYGNIIYTAGFPGNGHLNTSKGISVFSFMQSVHTDSVCPLEGCPPTTRVHNTTIKTAPGASGSPVVNYSSRVVGVVYAMSYPSRQMLFIDVLHLEQTLDWVLLNREVQK